MANALIPLGVNMPDFTGAYGQGQQVYQNQQEQGRQNALRQALQEFGPAAMQGDKNALAELSKYDPNLSMGLMGEQQQMDLRGRADQRAAAESQHGMANDNARLEVIRKQAAEQSAEHVAKMSEIERQQAAAELDKTLAAATQAKNPEEFDAIVSQTEEGKEYVGQFDKRDQLIAMGLGLKDALTMNAGPQQTDDMREYEFYAQQAQAAGQQPMPFEGWQTKNKPVTNTMGTPPAGYKVDYDEQNRPVSMSPLPGSPAALDAEIAEKGRAAKTGRQETSTGVVLDAAKKARDLIGIGSTGVVGQVMGNIGQTNAAEVQRQTDVLKSIATIENLQAMRNSSPTGGALGNVTASENQMLAAASGALDPAAGPGRYAEALDNYERTVLRIVHGPEEGDRIFNETRAKPEGNKTSGGVQWKLLD